MRPVSNNMTSRTKHRFPLSRKFHVPGRKSSQQVEHKHSPYYRADEDEADQFPSDYVSPVVKRQRSWEVQPFRVLGRRGAALATTSTSARQGSELDLADRLTHGAPPAQIPQNHPAPQGAEEVASFSDILNSARLGDTAATPTSTTPVPAEESQPEQVPSLPDMRHIPRAERVKRWDPANQTVSDWDGLRRDSELWLPQGDCLIHLYPKGQSRRGPSFCVPFRALREARCGALMGLCSSKPVELDSAECLQYQRYGMCTATAGQLNLYLPAPDFVTKGEAFQWHLTTRNFFAFVCGRPLVGAHLGKAFVDLQERMQSYRKHIVDNDDDLLEYADAMGYTNFVNCPDYALAMLYYAEHFQIRDLYIDAFAHCVGMNHALSLSDEFMHIGRVTKTLINKAFLDIDIHVGKVSKAIKSFLEDELSSAHLGLGQGARAHLDRFRSFLYSYYVEKYGFWPPREFKGYPKALLKSMYFDFRNLYEYLVDLNSTDSFHVQRPSSSGGLCVLQNLIAFDTRHSFAPLPYPLPLLPEFNEDEKIPPTHKALSTLKLHSSKNAKAEKSFQVRTALSNATNSTNISVASAPLVRAYARFERDLPLKMEEKVTMADARKVRWILVYATLQMLISVIRAPPEVRDTEYANYPLCCLLTGTPPWAQEKSKASSQASLASSLSLPSLEASRSSGSGTPEVHTPSAMVQPDFDFNSHFPRDIHDVSNTSVSVPQDLPVEMPAPLRVHPLLRNTLNSPKAPPLPLFSSIRCSIKRQMATRSTSQQAWTLDEFIANRDLDTSIARTTSSEDLDGLLYSLNYKDALAAKPPKIEPLPPAPQQKLHKRPAKLDLQKSEAFENGNVIKFATSPILPQTPLSPAFTAVWSTASETETEASSVGQSTPSKEITDPLEGVKMEPPKEIERPSSATSSVYSASAKANKAPAEAYGPEIETDSGFAAIVAQAEKERPATAQTAIHVEASTPAEDDVLSGYAAAKRREVMTLFDALSMGPFRSNGIATD